ncbi:hypothetical protein OTU49_008613 [Cherax quadricarinatus]|uniref:Uncharacterized protein n=1 Tax=Cherax quadricarinatus TaxID=27406 RepID=A0AAW0WNQ4_CHEQU
MSGMQGIIVCGEASESDEEEEFCAAMARGQIREANASLEKNLSQCIRGPLAEQANRISHLIATIPATQTSTLSAHSSLSRASRNLSHTHLLIKGLANNPLSTLKAP